MTRSDPVVTRVPTRADHLGEGPLWDPREGVLYWVDVLRHLVRRLDPRTGEVEDHAIPATVASLAIRERGGMVLALKDGFYFYDFATRDLAPAARLGIDHPKVRLNDGKVDRQGRFLAGSLHLREGADEEAQGQLYRLSPDLTVEVLERGVAISNGPCFSPDGRTLYFADSTRRTIHRYAYDPLPGAPLADRSLFLDASALDTSTDGATVDAEGYVWTALVRSGRIGRFAPDGTLERTVAMPCRHPTSVMFGGPDLDVAYVTSISKSSLLNDDGPDAGGLFAVRGLGVTGLPEPFFAG